MSVSVLHNRRNRASARKDNINYLFFLPAGAETNGVAGYNPFGYNFGFIYEYLPVRLGPHELGHGIGSLRHPFDETVAVKGQTDNLMDYNDKQSLWHFQWDMMQKPPKRIFKWRFEESEAEMAGYTYIVNVFSPYFAQKILVNIEKYNNSKTVSERNTCSARIFELLNKCYVEHFTDSQRVEIVEHIKNKEAIDLEYLNKYNRTMVVQPVQNGDHSVLNLVTGIPDKPNTEDFKSIKAPYTVKIYDYKEKLPNQFNQFIDAVFCNNLPGKWKKCSPQRINGKKALEYNETFIPDGYYSKVFVKYKLTDGSIVMQIFEEGKEPSKGTFKYLAYDNLWYDIDMDNFSDDKLGDEIYKIFTKIEVSALKQVGRFVIPVEDAKILIDGKDFDEKEASRLVAGGFLLLEAIPGGAKVFKLAKAGKIGWNNPGTKIIIRKLRREVTEDMTIDFACQFFANLLKQIDENQYKNLSELFVRTVCAYDYKSAVYDEIVNLTVGNNPNLKTSLTCVKELLLKLQKSDDVETAFTQGGFNCVVEVGALFFAKYLKGKHIPPLNQTKIQRFLSLLQKNMDNKYSYGVVEKIITNYAKQ